MYCCLIFCGPCRIADTWNGSGMLTYIYGAVLVQVSIPFMVLLGAYHRNLLRGRFNIQPQFGIMQDLKIWLLMAPMAAVQEARHVDFMVHHAEDNRHSTGSRHVDMGGGQVVGAPVAKA